MSGYNMLGTIRRFSAFIIIFNTRTWNMKYLWQATLHYIPGTIYQVPGIIYRSLGREEEGIWALGIRNWDPGTLKP